MVRTEPTRPGRHHDLTAVPSQPVVQVEKSCWRVHVRNLPRVRPPRKRRISVEDKKKGCSESVTTSCEIVKNKMKIEKQFNGIKREFKTRVMIKAKKKITLMNKPSSGKERKSRWVQEQRWHEPE